MRNILILVRKDFQQLRHNKAALILTFLVPFIMIWLFGQIFGVNRKDSGPNNIPLALVNASSHPGAEKLVQALRSDSSFRLVTEFTERDGRKRPLAEADLKPAMEEVDAKFRFALVLPDDLISAEKFGLHLKVLSNPRNEIEAQMVSGLLQKTIFTHVPELMGQMLQSQARNVLGADRAGQFNQSMAKTIGDSFGLDPAAVQQRLEKGDFGLGALGGGGKEGTGKASGDLLSSLVRIETVQVVGAEVKNQRATGIVGGFAMQFLLFAVSASATGLFRERDAGLFLRLLASPVTRAQILWGRFFYGVLLGLVQLLVLFGAGQLLFGIDVWPHLGALVVVCLLAAGSCTAFGMLVAAFAPNAEAVPGISTLLIMLMSALGGAWFPITIMPAFIQQFSKLTIVYWSMEGFSAVLWAGHGLLQILPILGVLAGFVAVVMTLSIWRFNRSNLFG